MVSTIHTSTLVGMEIFPVTCEVDLSPQLPAFQLVGLPSSMTQESKERVRAAIVNSGFDWPNKKITVNLLPSTLPKWGSHFELAMAVGILLRSRDQDFLLKSVEIFAVGELSLSGKIRPCGWLPLMSKILVQYLKRKEFILVAHPKDISECFTKLGISLSDYPHLNHKIIAVEELKLVVPEILDRIDSAPSEDVELKGVFLENAPLEIPKKNSGPSILSQVKEEPLGVLAALTAIVGKHHFLGCGSHGMGKSMLIKGICQASPTLSEAEITERESLLRSGVGFSMSQAGRNRNARPVVFLQASVTRAALEGSLLKTGQVLAGELSSAHLGILVADEFLEYRRDVLECLRQPLEEGKVRLQRAEIRTTLPSKFQLLASTNLCPCGYKGHARKACRCPKNRSDAYMSKLSGPILDRFDLVILVGQGNKPIYELKETNPELHKKIHYLLEQKNWSTILKQKPLEEKEESVEIKNFLNNTEQSHRSMQKIKRTAHTIAGMLGEEILTTHHLQLAQMLRIIPYDAIKY